MLPLLMLLFLLAVLSGLSAAAGCRATYKHWKDVSRRLAPQLAASPDGSPESRVGRVLASQAPGNRSLASRSSSGRPRPAGRAAVIVPCRGWEAGLLANLRSLFFQDDPDYELLFVVDSPVDGAVEIIKQLVARFPQVDARLVIAGPAVGEGQKVHNLLTAVSHRSPGVQFLVFLDSDSQPGPDWLREIVSSLQPKIGAVTGYRWLVPDRLSCINLAICSLNASFGGMMRTRSWLPTLWGGAWAIRVSDWDRRLIAQGWKGCVCEDLLVSQSAREGGWRIAFEPRAVLQGRCNYSWAGAWNFVRRQFLLVRFYQPLWWFVAGATLILQQVAFWGLLLASSLALGTMLAGDTSLNNVALLLVCLPGVITLYTIGWLRARYRQRAGRFFQPDPGPTARRAQMFDQWAFPLGGLLGCLAWIASAFGYKICWRGIVYRVNARGRVQHLTYNVFGQAEVRRKESRAQQEKPCQQQPHFHQKPDCPRELPTGLQVRTATQQVGLGSEGIASREES